MANMNMPSVASLYTVGAVIVLDTDGSRLLSKYYPNDDLSNSRKRQEAFEAILYSRTRKTPNSNRIVNQVILDCDRRGGNV